MDFKSHGLYLNENLVIYSSDFQMINDQNFGILTFTNRRRSNLIRSWRGSATTLSHRWPKFRKRVKLSRKHGSISWGSHVITDQLMMRSILVTYASSLIHQSVTRVIVHQESPFTKGTKILTLVNDISTRTRHEHSLVI